MKIKRYLRTIRKELRRRRYTRYVMSRAASVGTDLRVNAPSSVTGKTQLGNHVNFNGMSIRGCGECRIGDYFHSGKECIILTQNHNFDGGATIPYDHSYDCLRVVIEDFVWIGDRVMILPGVTIHEGAIIQAGSVVVSDIPYCGIAGGHPARVFKTRDVKHFEQLKREGRFW